MSRLGFGCANLASMSAGAGGRPSVRLAQHAFDRGVTFFDTADAYGDGVSEEVLARAFRSRRGEVTIATKGGFRFTERRRLERIVRRTLRPVSHHIKPTLHRVAESTLPPAYTDQQFSVPYLSSALDGSLRRLDGLPIDVYQLHEPGDIRPDDVLDWADRAMQSGKFRRFGVCLRPGSDPAPWLADSMVSFVHVRYGLLDQSTAEHQIAPAYERDADVIVHGVLGEGLLTDRLTPDQLRARTPSWAKIVELRRHANELGTTTTQLAIWFVRAHGNISTSLVGLSSIAHVDATVEAFATDLPPADSVASYARLLKCP